MSVLAEFFYIALGKGSSRRVGKSSKHENPIKYHPRQTRGERLHVRGKVVLVADGIPWLHDGEAGLALRGADAMKVRPGDQVEAVGFRELEDFLPVLSDVVIRPDSGPKSLLQPRQIEAAGLREGLHHGDFVAVTGHLLARVGTSWSWACSVVL